MAKNKPVEPEVVAPVADIEAIAAEVVAPVAESRNLTREMLAQELGEEEARRRIP